MDAEERSTEISMEELAALVDTAGADTVAMVLQTRQSPDPRSFLGAGKLQEIKEIVTNNECDLVVIDNELSPSQARAIEEELGVRVVDRSGLILDIFAQRARTKEGRLQVQLAQYEYLLPRLTGMWTHLKRQAGTSAPIGTRGPGETQLETDRRHIRRIIQNLQADLEQVRRVRSTQRRRREKNAMPMVALVGYTNAGKSTVLNRLTRSDIPFKATLEELRYADLLLHVIDVSAPDWEEQAKVTDALIRELGASATPVLRIYNKCDAIPALTELPHTRDGVCISARTGEGVDTLLARITEELKQ